MCAPSRPRKTPSSIAYANPQRSVVFFVAGFETTAAPVAAMLEEGPAGQSEPAAVGAADLAAVAMLLDSEQAGSRD